MKILSRPKGNAEEYGRWSVNAYLGCPHSCEYCYLQTGPGAKTLGGTEARLKAGIVSEAHAYHVAMTEITEHRDDIIRDGGLFFTFTSDPCLPETRCLNFTIAHEAIGMGIPVVLLTKSLVASTYYRHAATGQEMHLPLPNEDPEAASRLAFGWTLTGHDEQEPHAHADQQNRLRDMHAFHAAGYKTWASLEPVIDFNATAKMFQRALSSGCRHFKIGLLTSRTRVAMQHYRRQYGDRLDNYLDLFIDEIQELNQGHNATIYWKQSIQQLAGHDLTTLPNAVDARWNMFNN